MVKFQPSKLAMRVRFPLPAILLFRCKWICANVVGYCCACPRKIFAKLSSGSSEVRLFKRMKHQMTKGRQLLGLLLVAGLLCSCASSAPYSETMIDTSTQKRNTVLPDAPPQPPLTYQPGVDPGPGFGPPGGH